MAGEIIVGIGPDGSGTAAAHVAAQVASRYGTSLVLVFGYESSPMGPRGGALEDEVGAVVAEEVQRIRDELGAAHPDLAIEIELVRDRPVESLIRVGDEHDALAIVVGHGGRGPVAAALLGSVTYELVHRAPRPVLVVPDPD